MANNFNEAAAIRRQLFPFVQSLFLNGNPAGIKYAMKLASIESGELRLPLVEANEAARQAIEEQVGRLGIKAK